MIDDGNGGGCGIYGKLPSKRDFIALHISGPVLAIVEGWLQGGIAASRNQMGKGWQDVFLTTPLWRFWLGKQVAGVNCVGSLMPSVDGVGRYFPLAILSECDPRVTLQPPLDDPLEAWFEPAEARLLSALDPNFALDAFGLVEGLANAQSVSRPPPPDRSAAVRRGAMWRDDGEGRGGGAAIGDRDEDYRIAAQMRTYWWTKGGDRFGSRFYSHPGMPDPSLYVNLMTGEI